MLVRLYTRTKAPSLDFIHLQLEKQQKRIASETAKTLADIKEAIKAVTSSSNSAASVVVQPKEDDEQEVKFKENKESYE
jgi:hypothetical protein